MEQKSLMPIQWRLSLSILSLFSHLPQVNWLHLSNGLNALSESLTSDLSLVSWPDKSPTRMSLSSFSPLFHVKIYGGCCQSYHLLTVDFRSIIFFLTLQDLPKLNRCTELLSMNEELKQARKVFESDEEKLRKVFEADGPVEW